MVTSGRSHDGRVKIFQSEKEAEFLHLELQGGSRVTKMRNGIFF